MVLGKISAIIDLLTSLTSKASINNSFIMLLIKITGIAFLTEFAVSVCKDSGETAIANKSCNSNNVNSNNSRTFRDYSKNITIKYVKKVL